MERGFIKGPRLAWVTESSIGITRSRKGRSRSAIARSPGKPDLRESKTGKLLPFLLQYLEAGEISPQLIHAIPRQGACSTPGSPRVFHS